VIDIKCLGVFKGRLNKKGASHMRITTIGIGLERSVSDSRPWWPQ